MRKTAKPTREITFLDDYRERRRYIAIAEASEDWQQIKASFALEGIEATEDDAERAGRLILYEDLGRRTGIEFLPGAQVAKE